MAGDSISVIMQKLGELNAKYNALIANGKKIPELPHQSVLNGLSKIHVSLNNTSEYLEIQQIIDAVEIVLSNQLLEVGSIDLTGNNLTVNPNVKAFINGVNYVKSTATVLNVPFCDTDKTRIDLIVINTLSQVVRIAGSEVIGVAVRPILPIDSVLITELNVTDGTINYTGPILGIIDVTASHNKGYYNILTNSPALSDSTGTAFDYVTCSVAGTRDFGSGLVEVGENDRLEHDGVKWFKAVNNNQGGSSSSTPLLSEFTLVRKGTASTNNTIEIDDLAHGFGNDGNYWSLARYKNYTTNNNIHDPANYEPLGVIGITSL